MIRYFIISLLLLLSLYMQAQTARLEVVSFKKNGLSTAALEKAVKDPHSGKLCGMLRIKCVTPNDLSFTFGMNGSYVPEKVEIQEGTGEINVFVPVDIRQVNFKSKSGRFNVVPYVYNDAIEPAAVYEVEVRIIGAEETNNVLTTQFLTMRCDQEGAIVYLNDNSVGEPFINKVFKKKLSYGKYEYRVEIPMHYPEQGTFTLTKESPVNLSFTARKAYGEIALPNDPSVELWIDGELITDRSASMRRMPGTYSVEFRKQSHRPARQEITLKAGDLKQLTLPAFTPVVGHLEVDCSEVDATIRVDGKAVGKTPVTLQNLLIGEHEVELSLQGFAPYKTTVTIAENKLTQINPTLKKGANTAITQPGKAAERIYVSGTGDDATLLLTKDPTNLGTLFQFGSIVAWNYGNKGTAPSDANFNPTTTVGWSSDWKSDAAHTLMNLRAGKGDPCRLVGYSAGYIRGELAAGNVPDNKQWRTPTNAENGTFGASYSDWTSLSGISGRYFNPGNSSGTFLPAAGYRYTDGTTNGVGSYGDYWSSTVYNSFTGYYLYFNSGYVGPQYTNYQTLGFSVRCIRQ